MPMISYLNLRYFSFTRTPSAPLTHVNVMREKRDHNVVQAFIPSRAPKILMGDAHHEFIIFILTYL